jgi:hypothetical protein
MSSLLNKPYTVGTLYRGELNERSKAVVMENTTDRNKMNRLKVNYFITENPSLFEGNSTVAIFKLKGRVKEEPVEQLNSTSLFVSYLNKKKSAASDKSDTQ